MSDPWQGDPWATSEPQEPTDSPWDTSEGPIENNKECTVQENTNSEIVVTFKQHGGYDAPWLVVHAADAEDAEKQLLEIRGGNLLKAVSVVAGEFAGTKGAVQPARAQAAPQQAPQQQTPRQDAPSWSDGRSCSHGVMVAREGTNKNGNPYKVYFCAAPQNTPDHEKCKAVWVK